MGQGAGLHNSFQINSTLLSSVTQLGNPPDDAIFTLGQNDCHISSRRSITMTWRPACNISNSPHDSPMPAGQCCGTNMTRIGHRPGRSRNDRRDQTTQSATKRSAFPHRNKCPMSVPSTIAFSPSRSLLTKRSTCDKGQLMTGSRVTKVLALRDINCGV